jgi:steroid delta-isomerase-like uncharacterized protein
VTVDELIRAQTRAFNLHDPSAWAACYSPQAVVADPQYPEPLRGRDAVRKDMSDFFGAFPDITAEVTGVVSQGDTYAYEVSLSGTHTGPLLGPSGHIPATDRRVRLAAGAFGRLDAHGNIVEEHRYYDLAGMLAQLGLME